MKLLITGSKGQLGRELIRLGHSSDLIVQGNDLPELDITDAHQVRQWVSDVQPDIIINAAAYTQVDKAESELDVAFAVNRDGPAHLAHICRDHQIPLIHVSTDFVFDGKKEGMYVESDPVAPLGVYGKSKAAGEDEVRSILEHHVIIRTAWLYSVHGQNFVKTILRLAREQETLRVIDDQHGCPTSARDLAGAILSIVDYIRNSGTTVAFPWGTYHYCGEGVTTWHGFASEIVRLAHRYGSVATQQVIPIPTEAYPLPAKRPANSALNCNRIQSAFGIRPMPWQQSLDRVVRTLMKE